ncbi:hypothetical protein WKH31_18800 [Metabacillus indicus]|uniref:hypothetical protein n=1 Tax=Metabacillus indicus TaxID=246786 RepID=UPI003173EF97
MNYSYEELVEDLVIGREIEFFFNTKKFYIGCGTGRYMFWEFNNQSSEIIGENTEDLLAKVKIEGESIKVYGSTLKLKRFSEVEYLLT